MGKYQNILLDLDGTILDSGPGIKKSVQYALDHFSLYHQPEEKLRRFIGPALTDSFMRVYGFSTEQAEEALSYYREYYPTNGIFDASLYPGMEECIKTLTEQGKKVILLTAKPIFFAAQITKHFRISDYFFLEIGTELTERDSSKAHLIEKALREGNLKKEECLMVGDTKYDIDAAKEVGIDSVAALYGYGSPEEIASANYSIQKPLDLLSLV